MQAALAAYKTSCPSTRTVGSENLTNSNICPEIDFLMHKADLLVKDALQTIRDVLLTATTPQDLPNWKMCLRAADMVLKLGDLYPRSIRHRNFIRSVRLSSVTSTRL